MHDIDCKYSCNNCCGRGWNMDDDVFGNYGQHECEYCNGSGLDKKFCDCNIDCKFCDCEVDCKCKQDDKEDEEIKKTVNNIINSEKQDKIKEWIKKTKPIVRKELKLFD